MPRINSYFSEGGKWFLPKTCPSETCPIQCCLESTSILLKEDGIFWKDFSWDDLSLEDMSQVDLSSSTWKCEKFRWMWNVISREDLSNVVLQQLLFLWGWELISWEDLSWEDVQNGTSKHLIFFGVERLFIEKTSPEKTSLGKAFPMLPWSNFYFSDVGKWFPENTYPGKTSQMVPRISCFFDVGSDFLRDLCREDLSNAFSKHVMFFRWNVIYWEDLFREDMSNVLLQQLMFFFKVGCDFLGRLVPQKLVQRCLKASHVFLKVEGDFLGRIVSRRSAEMLPYNKSYFSEVG